jgi:hypothetical protein
MGMGERLSCDAAVTEAMAKSTGSYGAPLPFGVVHQSKRCFSLYFAWISHWIWAVPQGRDVILYEAKNVASKQEAEDIVFRTKNQHFEMGMA